MKNKPNNKPPGNDGLFHDTQSNDLRSNDVRFMHKLFEHDYSKYRHLYKAYFAKQRNYLLVYANTYFSATSHRI